MKVGIIFVGNVLLSKPVKKVREGWYKAFQLMHERKEDALVINDSLDMEMENWEW